MGTYKYFMFCIMLPVFVLLIAWWIPTISGVFSANKCKCENQDKSNIVPKELQSLIISTIAFGIKKFLEHQQKNKEKA